MAVTVVILGLSIAIEASFIYCVVCNILSLAGVYPTDTQATIKLIFLLSLVSRKLIILLLISGQNITSPHVNIPISMTI